MVTNLDHLNLSVHHFDETAAWYKRVFDFQVVERGTYKGRPWGVLKSGAAMLCIYENPERTFVDGDALKERKLHGLNHFALKITERKIWEDTVRKEQIKINYGGPVKWPNSTSWYVNDPTGYEIEVVFWEGGEPKFPEDPSRGDDKPEDFL